MAKLVIGTNKTGGVAAIYKAPSSSSYAIEKTVDANGKLSYANTMMSFEGVKNIDDCALECAYEQSNIPVDVDMSDLTTITGYGACYQMFNVVIAHTAINSIITNYRIITT